MKTKAMLAPIIGRLCANLPAATKDPGHPSKAQILKFLPEKSLRTTLGSTTECQGNPLTVFKALQLQPAFVILVFYCA